MKYYNKSYHRCNATFAGV